MAKVPLLPNEVIDYKGTSERLITSYGALTGLSVGALLWYIDQLKDEEHKKWFLKLLGYALGSGILGGLAGRAIGKEVSRVCFPEPKNQGQDKTSSSRFLKRGGAISDVSAIAGTTTGLLAWLNRLRKKEREKEKYERWFRDLVLLVTGGYFTGLWLGYSADIGRVLPKAIENFQKEHNKQNAPPLLGSSPPNNKT